MAGTVDVLLGNLEDAIKADNKEAARHGLVTIARETDFGTDPALDPRQLPRQPLGARRPDHPGHRDRRQARRDHGPEGAGRRGHRVRRPVARPARGPGRADRAAAGARDPRDRPRRGQRRGDLRRQPADAGPQPRPGRPRRRPADEDHPRRRRPSRLPGPPGPARPPTASTSRASARRTSRTCGTTRSPGWSTPARRTGSTPTTARSATSPTRSRARTSSATPTCSAASARGACTRTRSRSPTASSPPASRTSRTRAGSSLAGDGRRHRRGHARREDGGRRLAQAVPGPRRARRAARRARPGAEEALRRDRPA